MKIIRGMPPTLDGQTDVSIDIEMFGQEKAKLHRPHGTFACISLGVEDSVYMVTEQSALKEVFYQIKGARHHIYHNAMYDIRQLSAMVKMDERPVWCTMMVEKVLWGGYFGIAEFSLQDLVRRYLSIHMTKDPREEFSTRSYMTDEMVEYAAKDAYYTLRVKEAQEKEINDRSYDMRAYWEVDAPAMWVFLDFLPVKVDVPRWLSMADEFVKRGEELENELGFNVNSGKQISEKFKYAKFSRTDKGNPKTDEDALLSLRGRIPANIVDKILLARQYRKASSTYGEDWIKNFVEDDGLVYADFHVTGTETGRPSCVSGDTILDTTIGKLKIRDVDLTSRSKYGILTHTGQIHYITDKFNQGVKPVWNILLSNGSTIEVTDDHKLLTPDGWRYVNELQKGNEICSNVRSIKGGNRWTPQNTERRKFQETDIRRSSNQRRNSSYIWDTDGNCIFIQKGILSSIQRANRKDRIRESKQGTRESELLCRAFSCYIGQECIRTEDIRRKNRVCYCTRVGGRSSNSIQKFTKIQDENPQPKTSTNERHGLGEGITKNRNFDSWNSRASISLRRRPTCFLPLPLYGILSDARDALLYKKTINKTFLFQRSRKSIKGSYLLEFSCGGDPFIKSSSGYRYPPYSSVSIQHSQSITNGRFLFPARKFDCGDKWVNPLHGYRIHEQSWRNAERYRKVSFNGELGDEGEDIFNCRCKEKPKSDCFGNSILTIQSIQYAGVKDTWDIEVETDHSYVAQGFINHNCSSPNLLNIPARKIPEYRGLFISDRGKLLISDISAQEPACLAYLSRDQNLINIFKEGRDVHLEVARAIYNDPTLTKQKDSDKRAVGKIINLGTSYGMSAKGISEEVGISIEESEKFLYNYFRTFPMVQLYIDGQRNKAYSMGFVYTVVGRRVWINPYSDQWSRNAINAPIQGSAAEFTKKWLIKFRGACHSNGLKFPVCNVVYDELVCDIEANLEDRYKVLQDETFADISEELFPGVPIKVETISGNNWGCKK
jgi:DNA polymerase I-like protein with 3'-5' exonuclease and polymerase domains